ncbi:hypothetical protein [Chitinophaga sp.]|uniref:hypothetical protein n=1 Tax=Chitinophaga sp. TaxID=1869181 RepID=UPI00263A22AD|nr:hypothetical protein [uncultured Chitinophaga sp.]
MTYLASALLSYTILIPLVVALVRVHKIRTSYFPFLVLLLLAFTTEVASEISLRLTRENTAISNIYSLLEIGVILWQFHAWGFLRRRRALLIVLAALSFITWITENIGYGRLETHFCSATVFLNSLIVVFLCINEINALIASYSGTLLRNARFLICLGLMTISIYSLITEGTLLIDPQNAVIDWPIFYIFSITNAIVNVVYAIAVFFIPVRDDYYFSRRFKA